MSKFLFAQPSFIAGMARSFDLGGVFDCYNLSKTGPAADAIAQYMDWKALADELRKAFEQHEPVIEEVIS